MSRYLPSHPLRAGVTYLLALIACVYPSLAQDPGRQNMIFEGYFEEWGIRYSRYNIADLQKNGVADQLTHLIPSFGQCHGHCDTVMRHCRSVGCLSGLWLAAHARKTRDRF